ncbi:MAG: alcohol dehydrogenase catalytic domain-containing protein, partial [Candidatus Binatia bacterium]
MRATVMRNSKLVVDTLLDPEPGPGEALVKTLACGICGSDLHALKHADKMIDAARESGAPFVLDASRDVVMGHEFCAEVVDYGPGTDRIVPPGRRVVAMPVIFRGTTIQTVGYSNECPGGYG